MTTDAVLCTYCRTPLAPEEIDSRPNITPTCVICAAAQRGSTGSPASVFAVFMMVIGVGVGIYGVLLAFGEPSAKIVGGDAFNYQIYAARGLVVMAGGILLVLLGLTAATLSNYRRN